MSLPDEQIRAVRYMRDALYALATEPGKIAKRRARDLCFSAIRHCPFPGTLELWYSAYQFIEQLNECAKRAGQRKRVWARRSW